LIYSADQRRRLVAVLASLISQSERSMYTHVKYVNIIIYIYGNTCHQAGRPIHDILRPPASIFVRRKITAERWVMKISGVFDATFVA